MRSLALWFFLSEALPREDDHALQPCQGPMIRTQFLDFDGGFGEMRAQSWRCVNRGHVHDQGIARNRLLRPAPVWGLSSEAFIRSAV